jgi:hypothetical protein
MSIYETSGTTYPKTHGLIPEDPNPQEDSSEHLRSPTTARNDRSQACSCRHVLHFKTCNVQEITTVVRGCFANAGPGRNSVSYQTGTVTSSRKENSSTRNLNAFCNIFINLSTYDAIFLSIYHAILTNTAKVDRTRAYTRVHTHTHTHSRGRLKLFKMSQTLPVGTQTAVYC